MPDFCDELSAVFSPFAVQSVLPAFAMDSSTAATPSSSVQPERQVFRPQAAGRRLRWMLIAVSAVVLLFTGMHAVFLLSFPDAHEQPLVWATLFLGPLLVGVVWYGARIRYYLIEGEDLVVDRPFFPVRIPLSQYTLVHEFRGRVGHVEKIIGNDGLGAISGRFNSKEHGRLRIQASDLEHAVMLEGPEEKLIVSPADMPQFLEAVLRHIYRGPESRRI